MTNALLWTARPPAPRRPRPGELLWETSARGERYRCELRTHGDSPEFACVEAQILDGVGLLLARTFPSRELTLMWAERRKIDLERGWIDEELSGWIDDPTRPQLMDD